MIPSVLHDDIDPPQMHLDTGVEFKIDLPGQNDNVVYGSGCVETRLGCKRIAVAIGF